MPNVAELIRDHVTLQVRCVDRLYLNGYVPGLQSGGGVVAFLRRACGQIIPSPAGLGQVTEDFKHRLRTWAAAEQIPWLEFRKGERKDDVVERYRRRYRGTGVVLVGVAQERAWGWTATKEQTGRRVHFAFHRRAVHVNHYYVYVIDPDWGPAFLKICGYAPYGLKLCLNGHEWVKRQLARRGIRFTPLDNGFLQCAEPAALQAACDRLDARAVERFLARWQALVPLPLTRRHQAAAFRYQLSILQIPIRTPCHPIVPPSPGHALRVEQAYRRHGVCAHLAAWDVHRARLFGRVVRKISIPAFDALVAAVMAQAPYRAARRVFWIVDGGTIHRGQRAVNRLQARFPNLVLVRLPTHASWLNQIEIYFSILQRKALTPADFGTPAAVATRIRDFQQHCAAIAKPFAWQFTRRDLHRLMERWRLTAPASVQAAA